MIKKLFLNDRFILGLIVINAALLFFEGYQIHNSGTSYLTIIDHLITFLFIVEAIVKIKQWGLRVYFKGGWNRFDFILVIFSLPAFITFMSGVETFDVSYLLVFRIFRILRVFKSFRFFQFIPNINSLVSDVKRAMKSSVFVLLGFIIFIVVTGILSHYIFGPSGSDMFSSPMKSLYSTFKVFTIEGWFEIPEEIIEHYGPIESFFTYLYFIVIVLLGGILGLSLITSIFVDSMVSDNNDALEAKVDGLERKIDILLEEIQYIKKPRE
ncbi:ion transporter [Carboxylicivirga sp. N1Y90]|uniref:ion transporter n=1 Tax=Carboxylicivirga fragile TaxID=3417571 RepID=UPI003D32C351|nr:ion transporter [Marinilabiliaceae bacterium N1Y90]